MIKQVLKLNKVKSYMTVSEDIFPFILHYNGKEYEIRYTPNGGLVMTKYENKIIEKVEN